MFFVKKTEMVNKTLRMPVPLVRDLERIAKEQNVSLNNLIAQCCEYALEQMGEPESRGHSEGNKKATSGVAPEASSDRCEID